MAHSAPAHTQDLIPNQCQQTWTRLALIILASIYIWLHGRLFHDYQTLCLSAVSIYILWQLYTFIDIPRHPLSTSRFLISPLLDALLIAIGMILDGGQSSAIFLVYFVMIMSNGVRFGNPMLLYSQALALLSYLCTSAFTYLDPQLSLDIPLLLLHVLSLLLLPYYIYTISKHAKASFKAKKQAQKMSFGILDRSPVPIFTFQQNKHEVPRITYSNASMAQVYRDDITSLIGEQVDVIALLEDGNEVIKACQKSLDNLNNKPFHFYIRGRNADEQILQIMGQTSCLHLQGKTLGICFLIDITQNETMHSDMEKNMHQGHVSTLVSGIAHDFRNILTSIIGSAEVMQFSIQDQSIRDQLGLIIDAGERGSEMLSNLLSQNTAHELVNPINHKTMRQSLTSMVNLLRIQLPAHIQLQLDIEGRLPAAAISLTQLEQILMNLIKNATESMHSSGRINIQLYANYNHEFSNEQSPALTISIEDEGIGIAPEDIDKICKPFWTSRSKEGGTGLGLAMVQRIVRNNDGNLDIQSTLGKGSQINITFPPISDSDPHSNEKNEDSIQASNKHPNAMIPWHILLVDDSPTVLNIHQHLLEHMGHKVTAVENAERALEIYQASLKNSNETFNLIATDFLMGGMDGVELSKLIRQHDKQLPILIITAYGDAKKLQQGQGLQVSILGKPTSYDELASQIMILQNH